MTTRTTTTEMTERGFTLLEVLIATTAFAIVLAAINAVFYGALRLRNRSTEALDEALPLQRAVATIQHDLVNMVLPGGTMAGSFQTTSITNSLPGQISPDFYTASGFIDETSPWGEVQKVSYALTPSGNRSVAGMDLVRAVTRNLLPVAGYEAPASEWLLSGVQSLAFSYFDGTQWRNWWDSTTADPVSGLTNALPQAIKVQIQLAPPLNSGRIVRLAPVEIVAPIMVQPRGSETLATSQ